MGDQPPIYIHLSYEKYNSVYIKESGSPAEFRYLTMVPPGVTHFFFTVNDLQTTAQSYAARENPEGLLKVPRAWPMLRTSKWASARSTASWSAST